MSGTPTAARSVWLPGAVSGIGEAVARGWAGDSYFLSGQAADSTPGRTSDTKSESERG
jgi:NADP-dependent 3-hydroxy acid dehydrogenase YdfG